MTTLRSRILARDIVVGTFCAIPHPMVIEMVAGAGWDFIVIEAEHTQVGRADFEPLLRAAQVAGTPALVRVPGNDKIWIGSALDSGAAGVLLPRVNTAAEAKAAVAATRYPPMGERGLGPGRHAGYGTRIMEAAAGSNQEVVLAIQIETKEGLANIEEIAAVDGIDAIYIGPGDLSLSLGAMGPEGRPVLDRAIATIAACCKRRGRPVGIFAMTPDHLRQSIGDGLTFLTLAADSMFLGHSVKDAADTARRLKGGAQSNRGIG